MASGQGPQTWTAGTGASVRSSPVSGGAVSRQRVITSMTGMEEDVSACGEPKELTIPKTNVPTPSTASATSPIRSLGQKTHGQLPSPAGVRGQPCPCQRSAVPSWHSNSFIRQHSMGMWASPLVRSARHRELQATASAVRRGVGTGLSQRLPQTLCVQPND